MTDNTIEINNDEINVEEIMAKIRENIRRRQAAGELPPDPDSIIASSSKNCAAGESDDAIQRDLTYINNNWDIRNNSYFISSHHPHIGKFLVKGRQLVHGEVRRYIDPVIYRQNEFNASTVHLINHTSQKCAELENTLPQIKQEVNQKINEIIDTTKSEIDSKIDSRITEQLQVIEELRNEINQSVSTSVTEIRNDISPEIDQIKINQKKELDILWENLEKKSPPEQQIKKILAQGQQNVLERVDSLVEKHFQDLVNQMGGEIHSQAWLAHLLEKRATDELMKGRAPAESPTPQEINYFLFEERFRGSRDDIKQRQQAFLPYFEKCSRVLDIGCGRGEFLELLKEHTIGGFGVDCDQDMVAYCRSRQLEVVQIDAIAFLETLKDESLDGIFIDQVVEHLEPEYLIRLLALCHQKMKFGYHIVVETVNPLSFVSFANFYIDMTHKRPVHPETLQYLISAVGFRECEKKFFSPVSDENRLKKVEGAADMNETEKKNVDVYNHNVDMLNTVLFGAQDYAVIGKK